MAWIDSTYVSDAIGAATLLSVCGDGSVLDQDVFDQFEASARAKVKAAALLAGYSLSDTTTDVLLKDLCLGQFVLLSYGMREGLEIPPGIKDHIDMLSLVRTGELVLNDAVSSRDGIGGVKFSSTDETSGKPRRFDRASLTRW